VKGILHKSALHLIT